MFVVVELDSWWQRVFRRDEAPCMLLVAAVPLYTVTMIYFDNID